MREVEYLDLEDLLAPVHDLRAGPVRDVGLIDSAAGRPPVQRVRRGGLSQPRAQGGGVAAFHRSQSRSGDGNKRLAWLATVVFLDLNLHRPDLTDDGAFDLVMDVAKGTADVEEIADRLRVSA